MWASPQILLPLWVITLSNCSVSTFVYRIMKCTYVLSKKHISRIRYKKPFSLELSWDIRNLLGRPPKKCCQAWGRWLVVIDKHFNCSKYQGTFCSQPVKAQHWFSAQMTAQNINSLLTLSLMTNTLNIVGKKKCKEQNSQGPVKYFFATLTTLLFFNSILNLFCKIQESLEICTCILICHLRFSYSEAAAGKTCIFICKWTRFI